MLGPPPPQSHLQKKTNPARAGELASGHKQRRPKGIRGTNMLRKCLPDAVACPQAQRSVVVSSVMGCECRERRDERQEGQRLRLRLFKEDGKIMLPRFAVYQQE